jgi:DNA-binding NtrC family response regulator
MMRTVLVVDDEMLIRWAVAESLSAAGFAVVEAGSAAEALAILTRRDDPITVALLDLKLSDSRDFSLMRRIKALAPGCRVILMTADGRWNILYDAIDAGFFGAVAKPFDMDVMAGLVRQAAVGE